MSNAVSVSARVRDLDRETAGFLRRLVAVVVDSLLLSPLAVFLFLPYIYAAFSGEAGTVSSESDWWRAALWFAVSFAYGALMLGRYSRTVGMMVLRIRVTRLDGADIGYRRAALRTALFHLAFAGLLMPPGSVLKLAYAPVAAATAIGLLWIMVDRAHQGYHDKIAGTLVMREQYCRGDVVDSSPRDGAPTEPTEAQAWPSP